MQHSQPAFLLDWTRGYRRYLLSLKTCGQAKCRSAIDDLVGHPSGVDDRTEQATPGEDLDEIGPFDEAVSVQVV